MPFKGGLKPKGEKVWPRDRPDQGAVVEFEYEGAWYPGSYDSSSDWPSPVWATEPGVVFPGTNGVACSAAKKWRIPAGAN